MNFLRQLAEGIAQTWQNLSLSARINIVMAGLLVAVVILVVVFTGTRPQYVTLTQNDDPKMITQIKEVLDGQGVPYRIEDNNSVIKVPMNRRSELQLSLVENNLPVGRSTPPGFELFSQNELMTNQWLQDVKYMRAVKGEIERQLMAFDFVEYATVNITHAREELFVAEQKPSEASVTLKTSRSLTSREVKGIVKMVSHAGGPNLNEKNITVALTDGSFLWTAPDSEYAVLANSRMELRMEEERQRETKLRKKLEELGIHGTVSVSAKMSFDRTETTSKKAAEGTVLSEYEVSTDLTSTENLPEGTPGALASVPEATVEPGSLVTTELNSETITNFEPSYTTTTTTQDGGEVVKYLVSLVVEGDYEEAEDPDEPGGTIRNYVGLSEDRREMLLAMAKATVGEGQVPAEVTVHDYPFDSALQGAVSGVEAVAAQARRDWYLQLLWNAVQIIAIIAGFFLFRMFLMNAIEYPREEAEEEEEPLDEFAGPSAEDMRRERVAEHVMELVNEDPETLASLIQTWLSEEEE